MLSKRGSVKCAVFVAIMCIALLVEGKQTYKSAPISVSMIQLIALPKDFDGKYVNIIGVLSIGREGDLLFLSKEDYDNGLISNAIWIKRPDLAGCSSALSEGRYVQVTGTFRDGFKQGLGTPDIGIPEVKTCRAWSDPDDPLKHKVQQLTRPVTPH
jgi:hypothetical protein